MEQLLLTVDFMHSKNIVHRDLKPDNILINKVEGNQRQFDVKIADFGLVTFLPSSITQKLYIPCGTACYISPEALADLGYREKADIFSLGSLLFNLLTCRYLFNGSTPERTLMRNMECNLNHINEYIAMFSEAC